MRVMDNMEEIYMDVDIVIVGFEMDVLLDTLVRGR